MMNIETDRLIVRDYVEEDFNLIGRLICDDNGEAYFPNIGIETIDKVKENIYELIKESQLENRTRYFFAIIMKETNEYIGEIGYTIIDDTLDGKVAKLEYTISPIHWEKDFSIESAKGVINYAFKQGNIIKIEYECKKDDIDTQRVVESLGMIKKDDIDKPVLPNSEISDKIEYKILKEEWELVTF